MWTKLLSISLGYVFVSAIVLLAKPKDFIAKVEWCHDGDTCRIKLESGLYMNVRLLGIDAPEVGSYGSEGQSLGLEAKSFTHDLLANQHVSVRQFDLDQYNRPIVEIRKAGNLVNTEVLSRGYAQAYRRGLSLVDSRTYLNAENQAKKNKLGIWSQVAFKSPQQWRLEHKSYQH